MQCHFKDITSNFVGVVLDIEVKCYPKTWGPIKPSGFLCMDNHTRTTLAEQAKTFLAIYLYSCAFGFSSAWKHRAAQSISSKPDYMEHLENFQI